ncbi:response regulator [Hirschia litorea]|uniref:Response regulator n=1 Tax=Hirschia litorea TaxID=1199156 RepID=A0ABW2IQ25_9PROT
MVDAFSNEKILIVEDNIESLQFLTDTLEGVQLSVHIATSGERAMEMLENFVPDLILMDAVMPGMGGFEATRQLKRRSALSTVPVIFMTGLLESEHVVDALESGGVDYVRKPVVIDELLARIKVHLLNARQSQSSRGALDAIGRYMMAIDSNGKILWTTPEAEKLIIELDKDWSLQEVYAPEVLRKIVVQKGLAPGNSRQIETQTGIIEVLTVSLGTTDEIILRLKEVREGAEAERLSQQFNLTQREAEVLLWVSFGKPNRVISDILGISPRTINKHLEHVFEKMGVETRAAATACAVRALDG